MENYEQKYKEIVERVKELHAAGNFFTKKQMEIILPQLAESEDERIRKNLIRMVQNVRNDSTEEGYYDIPFDNYLAYLEKQAVKVGDDGTEVLKAYREGMNAGRKEMFDHPEYYGLQPRRMYDYETGKMNPEWSDDDERIRKELIDGVRQIRCKNGITQEQMLAWLEKQKPIELSVGNETMIEQIKFAVMQMPSDREDTKKECLAWLEKQKDFQAKVKQRMEYLWDKLPDANRVNEGNYTPEELKTLGAYMELEMNFDKGSEEKQKEQKPTEWSEEDKHRCDDAIYFLETAKNHYADTSEIELTIEWLKSLQPQAKQEWSEDDKFKLEDIITGIDVGIGFYEREGKHLNLLKAIIEAKEWLKSLRPQSKKELSIEKAIKWLDDTFYFLDNSSGRGRDCEITTHDFDSLEEMYDSFRKAVIVDSEPHWKPSEEQMNSLRDTIVNTKGYQYSVYLPELYEQLKKLM